jgi:hypothetical protein
MDASVREMPEFELALLRRGLDELAAGSERCGRCNRTPLVGEHVHIYKKQILCDLCVELERKQPESSRLVHGPAFGNSIRIIDQRAA